MSPRNLQTTYQWKGKNKSGMLVNGEMTAASPMIVKIQLQRQSINVIKIKRKSKPLFGSGRKKKISFQDIAVFTRQLSTMLSAGIPIVQSLEIIKNGQSNPTLETLIQDIKMDVESGTPFSRALSKYPLYFNDLYCSLIEAGEHSGTLDEMLIRVASYREKIESIKNKVKKALFYPIAVIVIALLISIGLLIFVVPKFESVFSSFGAQLPALTLIVVHLSRFLQQYWWLFFMVIGSLGWGLRKAYKRAGKFAGTIDELTLKLPIIGNILNQSAVARFARTLSTTFAAGLPLIDALQAVALAAGSPLYQRAILQIRNEVAEGQTIQQAMKNTMLFPSMVVQMIGVGEESGSLEFMLGKVADYYEEQVENAVNGLSSLIEPLIMVVLGTMIGGLVIAMYLPIFKMGDVVSGGG